MKKIMYVLSVLLLCNINMVKALENRVYYSDYGEWSAYSNDNYGKTELVDVEIERRYKWFKNKERGEYLSYAEGMKMYDNLNKDNYKYSDYSDWQENIPEETTERIIDTQKKYLVKKIKPIKTIYIMGGKFKTDEVDLNQIDIFNDGKKVNFKSFCGDCSSKYTLQNIEGGLILELDNFYYLDNIEIIIRPINISDIESLYFLVTSPREDSEEEAIFYQGTYEGNSNNFIKFSISDFSKVSPIYDEKIYYDYLPSLSISDYVEEVNLYRYKDKLYYFYSYDREYINGYFKNKDGYEKDENDYIEYYRYRSRDRIELKDYIEINRKDEFLEDYINSTAKYQIEGNIDYSKNGLYRVKIKTYFITKDVSVLININDNKKEITDNDQLINKYKELEKKYNNLLKEKNKYQKTNKFKNSNVCEKELEKVTLKNDDNEKKLKLSNQAYDYLNSSLLKINNNGFEIGLSWYLWLLLLILLLLIIIIIICKKRKNKNKF